MWKQTVPLFMHSVPGFTSTLLAFLRFYIFFWYISKEMFNPREEMLY